MLGVSDSLIEVNVIPEPTTVLLALSGLLALTFGRRRG